MYCRETFGEKDDRAGPLDDRPNGASDLTRRAILAALLLCATGLTAAGGQTQTGIAPSGTSALAIIGATVFDGTGAPVLHDATIVVVNGRIASVGPRRLASIPPGARQIDGRGKFVIPGLINTNVHLTPINSFERFSGPDDLFTLNALNGARALLEHGITTARDTYGLLPPLLAARDRIESGVAEGSSLLVAGNIIGWGGPWSYSFSGSTGSQPLTAILRSVRDEFVQGMGERLVELDPDALRASLAGYIEHGVDFIKIGVTTHFAIHPLLLFGPRALATMVAVAHERGREVDVHAGTIDGVWMATLAGVDVIEHPEVLSTRLPAELIDLIRSHGTTCSMLPRFITGPEWERFQQHLALGGTMWPPEKPPELMVAEADSLRQSGVDLATRPRTESVERFRTRRMNAEALIRTGCAVFVATDEMVDVPGSSSSVRMGDAYYAAVEGLVELGMSTSQALVAATRNGAMASGLLKEIGTITAGKRADLVILSADPIADIHNIRHVTTVVHRGRLLER